MEIVDQVRLNKKQYCKLGTEYTVTDSVGKTRTFFTSQCFFGKDEFNDFSVGDTFIMKGQLDRDDTSVLYCTELIAAKFPEK